ncbi:MAG: hypothetical protein ACYCQI_14725 [Gammaproteobacteria bacterium]
MSGTKKAIVIFLLVGLYDLASEGFSHQMEIVFGQWAFAIFIAVLVVLAYCVHDKI